MPGPEVAMGWGLRGPFYSGLEAQIEAYTRLGRNGASAGGKIVLIEVHGSEERLAEVRADAETILREALLDTDRVVEAGTDFRRKTLATAAGWLELDGAKSAAGKGLEILEFLVP